MENPKGDEIDPTEFRTPTGKIKHRRVDRLAQRQRLDKVIQDTANEIISAPLPPPKPKKPTKYEHWWEKEKD